MWWWWWGRGGASESVNVSHSAAVLHGFNKAGTCSVHRSHCAIEGLVHESGEGEEGSALSRTPVESGTE